MRAFKMCYKVIWLYIYTKDVENNVEIFEGLFVGSCAVHTR